MSVWTATASPSTPTTPSCATSSPGSSARRGARRCCGSSLPWCPARPPCRACTAAAPTATPAVFSEGGGSLGGGLGGRAVARGSRPAALPRRDVRSPLHRRRRCVRAGRVGRGAASARLAIPRPRPSSWTPPPVRGAGRGRRCARVARLGPPGRRFARRIDELILEVRARGRDRHAQRLARRAAARETVRSTRGGWWRSRRSGPSCTCSARWTAPPERSRAPRRHRRDAGAGKPLIARGLRRRRCSPPDAPRTPTARRRARHPARPRHGSARNAATCARCAPRAASATPSARRARPGPSVRQLDERWLRRDDPHVRRAAHLLAAVHVDVGRLDEALAIAGDVSRPELVRGARRAGGWRHDPGLLAAAYAREGASRRDPARSSTVSAAATRSTRATSACWLTPCRPRQRGSRRRWPDRTSRPPGGPAGRWPGWPGARALPRSPATGRRRRADQRAAVARRGGTPRRRAATGSCACSPPAPLAEWEALLADRSTPARPRWRGCWRATSPTS